MADGSGNLAVENDYFGLKNNDDCEIKVTTAIGKIISLKAKGSDTIGSLKLKIQYEENIPFDDQELIFNGKVLDNINTLANLHMKKESTLTLLTSSVELMEIFVNSFAGKTISLSVKPTDTIAKVKRVIKMKEGIPVDEQVLMFNNMVLGDNGTLFDFHINTKSTLTLMRKSVGLMQIFMKIFINILPEGRILILQVKPSDTIRNIKAKIQDIVNIPRDEQELMFNGIFLRDMDILADCITNESTVMLMRVSTGSMRIFIRLMTGKMVTLEVNPSDTIRNVKSKIQFETGYHHLCQQKLVFCGKQLDDNPTLADYNVSNESTIHFAFNVSNESTIQRINHLKRRMMKVLD